MTSPLAYASHPLHLSKTTTIHPGRNGDYIRLAFLLMVFLNFALVLTLAAKDPQSPLRQAPSPADWRGNAATLAQ